MTGARERLVSAVEVAARVVARLSLSLDEGIDFRTVSEAAGEGERDALRSLDAFLQRYQQSVEVMTHRLYPAIYRARQAGERPPALVTLLAFMEGEAALPDERAWIERVELRNLLVHEYPLTDEERHESIARAAAHAPGIVADLAAASAYIDRYSLLESSDDH